MINLGQPPTDITNSLRVWLIRLITAINSEIAKPAICLRVPAKPVIGKIYYFPASIAPTITSAGQWYYNGTAWVFIA